MVLTTILSSTLHGLRGCHRMKASLMSLEIHAGNETVVELPSRLQTGPINKRSRSEIVQRKSQQLFKIREKSTMSKCIKHKRPPPWEMCNRRVDLGFTVCGNESTERNGDSHRRTSNSETKTLIEHLCTHMLTLQCFALSNSTCRLHQLLSILLIHRSTFFDTQSSNEDQTQ